MFPVSSTLPRSISTIKETETGIGLMAGIKLVLSSGRFWPLAIWTFCVIGMSFAIGGLWGGPYLMQVYGLSKTEAGGVLSTFALVKTPSALTDIPPTAPWRA